MSITSRNSLPRTASILRATTINVKFAVRWCAILTLVASGVRSDAQQTIAVSIAQPIQAETADFDFTGTLEPARQAEVRAGMDGKVEKVNVKEGDEVVEGQLLVQLDDRELQRQIDAGEVELKNLKAELDALDAKTSEALKKSEKEKLPDSELAQITAARDLVAANIELKEAGLQRVRGDLQATRVTAPIAGRITQLNLKPGEQASSSPAAATLIAKVTQTDPVRACFDVDLAILDSLRNSQKNGGRGQFSMAVGDDEDFKYQGSLDYLGSRAEPRTGKVRACAIYPNPDRALDNVALAKDEQQRAVRVRFKLPLPRSVLLASRLAVGQDRNGRDFVLAVNDKNQIEVCQVTLGSRHAGLQVIEGGLRHDQWIVVGTPAAKLDSVMTHSPIDFTDVRFANLKPGTMVVPVKTSMPRAGTTLREKTQAEIEQQKKAKSSE